MSTVGYATLDIIPSVKGLSSQLQKQSTGPLTKAGKAGGAHYGSAAGASAGKSFSSKFSHGLKELAAPLAGLLAAEKAFEFFGEGITSARELTKAFAATAAIIKSTGGVANVTQEHVDELSAALEAQTAVDDSVIAKSAALVLTFKNVQNAGSGVSAIFDRTLAAATDLSAAGFGDVEGAAKTLAKALNDPVKGITALTRSGVTFSQKQKDVIGALVEQGDLLGAQKLILAEVESQVKGTAAAQVDGSDRAAVAFDNLGQKIGLALLPQLGKLADFAASDIVPALSASADGVGKLASQFGSLPEPIKRVAEAFALLKLSSLVGATGVVVGLTKNLSSAFLGLRIRVLLASDAFRAAEGNGLAASLAGIRAGAQGAALGLKALSLAIAPIAVVTAAITIFSAYKKGQQEAAAATDGFRATLEERTAALTADTRAEAANQLEKSGALKAAQLLGISLSDVTDAALGNEDAIKRITARYVELNGTDVSTAQYDAMRTLGVEVAKTSDALTNGVTEQKRINEAMDEGAAATNLSADATRVAADRMNVYATASKSARDALQKLIDKEEKRALNAIQAKRDQYALRETIKAAEKEARNGIKSLSDSTNPGIRNNQALLDLADQFDNSSPKVQNAKGAYEDIRATFIRVANEMGAVKGQAKSLADQLIKVPKTAPLRFQSKGYRERVAEIENLKELLKSGFTAELIYDSPRSVYAAAHPTTTTTPKTLGGPASRGGVNFNGPINVTAHNYDDFTNKLERKTQRAGLGGRP